MKAVPGLLVKSGAEGVQAFAFADGRAGAVKIEDGAARAIPAVTVALLRVARRRPRAGGGPRRPGPDRERPVLGGGQPVGEVRVTLPPADPAARNCKRLLRCNCKHTVVHCECESRERRFHRRVHPPAAGAGEDLASPAGLGGGVSNPYLSQIERGLRRPSAEILQQIAKGLRISAEALYVQAGILEDRRPTAGVRAARARRPGLTERQKQVLLEIYESFRRETAGTVNGGAVLAAEGAATQQPGGPRSPGAREPGGTAPGSTERAGHARGAQLWTARAADRPRAGRSRAGRAAGPDALEHGPVPSGARG